MRRLFQLKHNHQNKRQVIEEGFEAEAKEEEKNKVGVLINMSINIHQVITKETNQFIGVTTATKLCIQKHIAIPNKDEKFEENKLFVAYFGCYISNDVWFLDNGCSNHMSH